MFFGHVSPFWAQECSKDRIDRADVAISGQSRDGDACSHLGEGLPPDWCIQNEWQRISRIEAHVDCLKIMIDDRQQELLMARSRVRCQKGQSTGEETKLSFMFRGLLEKL